MHPVLHDNLLDHEAKAQDTVGGGCTKENSFRLVLSAMRLYRNFAILVASGRIEFPQQCAQAVVSTAASDLHEVYPQFYAHRNANCRIVNLDDALDTIENFGEELLCFHEGDACLKQYECEEEDEPEETEESECCSEPDTEAQCAYVCESSSESGVFSGSNAQAVEDQLNANYQERHGWEPSRARQDYHMLYANFLCGVPMTEDEQHAFNELHRQVVEEQVARVAAERVIQARRSRLTPHVSGEQVAEAIIGQSADRKTNTDTLQEANDIIAAWLFDCGQLEILANLARRMSLCSAYFLENIHNSGGILGVTYTKLTDRFLIRLKDGTSWDI